MISHISTKFNAFSTKIWNFPRLFNTNVLHFLCLNTYNTGLDPYYKAPGGKAEIQQYIYVLDNTQDPLSNFYVPERG